MKTPSTTPAAIVTTLRNCQAALNQYRQKGQIELELVERISAEIENQLGVLETLLASNAVFYGKKELK